VGRADEVDPGQVGSVEFFPELPVFRVQFDAIYQGRRGRAIDINALAIPRPAEKQLLRDLNLHRLAFARLNRIGDRISLRIQSQERLAIRENKVSVIDHPDTPSAVTGPGRACGKSIR